jgi:RND family efflux transporter MFP subunit
MSHPVNERAARPEQGKAGPLKTTLISLLIVLTGIALIWLIFKTEPTATRKNPARETAMLVDVQPAQQGNFSPVIEVMGQVMPAQEIMLRSRVGGEVLEQSDSFTPGHRVSKGDLLLKIDPADYRTTLQQRQAELQQAQADLALEQGRQAVAQQEFELLAEDIEVSDQALVLRKPQLEQARAKVAAARAALRKAQLELERTAVRAPFDAQILSRDVAPGSQVATGETLGHLVGIQQYWVEATVPLSKLAWLDFSKSADEGGAPVTLRHDTAWQDGQHRLGRLQQMVGELDDNARMARVLITVDDPLSLTQGENQPPLILGSFVRAGIEGRELRNVIRLERDLVRRNNTVWVMQDRKLNIREVDIAFQDRQYAYLRAGLEQGDQVITNNLASVVEGARLRLEEDSQ